MKITNRRLRTAVIIFAVILIFSGTVCLLDPDAGRISTLVCKPDAQGQTLCTVSIYGVLSIYRRSFPAEKFYQARLIDNHAGDSYDFRYGVTILTTDEPINFISATQKRQYADQKVRQINALFVNGEAMPPTTIIHHGIHWSAYLSVVLLIAGMIAVFLTNISRHPFSNKDHRSNTE